MLSSCTVAYIFLIQTLCLANSLSCLLFANIKIYINFNFEININIKTTVFVILFVFGYSTLFFISIKLLLFNSIQLYFALSNFLIQRHFTLCCSVALLLYSILCYAILFYTMFNIKFKFKFKFKFKSFQFNTSCNTFDNCCLC